ncbi:MAG: single-stranded DNA-binding protein [Clostridiales bacterium]|nr:single-stranded DNA-binding protein [Clostridiales bacterium]
MNLAILMGRLTKDPDISTSQNGTQIARYTIAIDRIGKDQGADFISCVAFNKSAEFADKYLKKGTKIAIEGAIRTGSYTNKDGQKVYTTDVIVNRQEFAESKGEAKAETKPEDGFMSIPGGIDDEIPFGN